MVSGAARESQQAMTSVFGFWPVSGFLGLDILGLYIAFQVSYRRARSFEEIRLTPVELSFRRVSHRGEARDWHLNPLWTKLVRETHAEFGLQRLALVSRGEAPYGIVYQTDAAADPGVAVVGTFPEDSHPPIIYPVAILSESKSAAAGAYLDFLKSDKAAPFFTEQGFTILK